MIRYSISFAIVFVSIAIALIAPAESNESRRVLVLHSFGRDFRPWSEYAKAIRLELDRQSRLPLEIHEHELVTAKSSDKGPEAAFVQYLDALFVARQPDLIISIGAPAASFVQRHRAKLFPASPMILTVVDQRRVKYSDLGPNDTVVAVAIDYAAALKSILQVLPDTEHIAMVVGTSPIEQFWREEIERATGPLSDRVNFTWYDTLSFEEILQHAASLPKNSAIFWELMIVDAAGVVHEEDKALARLHAFANAPIFSYTDAFFGREIVGGPLVPVTDAAQQVGAVAARILNGENAGSIKVPPVGMGAPKFDWRELQRWGIPETRLPPGSEIHFRGLSAWKQYRLQILAIAAGVLLQGLVIAWLLYEQRRRHRAEVMARRTMAELQSVNRLATAGELSASIAHEVKQPLTSVAANAYAALNWLRAGKPNLDEARSSLDRIVSAAHRANDIVSSVRAVFSKQEQETVSIDLNELIMSVLTPGRMYLRSHQVELDLQLADGLPAVESNRVQLQQVVLNLVTNAVEAMESLRVKRLIVRTARAPSEWIRITIEDTGSGIDPVNLDQIFKPLFTTKSRGMGIGLSVCRSIVEAHGGRIDARSAPQGGAIFEVDLPLHARKPMSPADGVDR
jgi:signal transduction histidine kinase